MIKEFCHYPVVLITGLLLLLPFTNVFADNGTSSCVNTTVNDDGSNTCYTITPPLFDSSGFTINGSEGVGEWSDAKSKNLSGDIAGSFKVLRSTDAVYLLITVNDSIYNANDRISVFFDVLHNHATTTDDIEFRLKRDTGGSPNHQKISSSGSITWNLATLGSELGVSSGGSAWTVELKLTASELGMNDLPPIIGFGIEAESLDSGDLSYWPTNFNAGSPSTTWANLKTRYPIEYMIVLDRSGSMSSQSKWDNAKKAANFLANTMAIFRDATYFEDEMGVVTFSWDYSADTNDTITRKPLSPISAFPVGNYTDSPPPLSSPGDCTPIGKGLNEAFKASNLNVTVPTETRERERVILLLSDGLHNSDDSHNCGVPDMPVFIPISLDYDPCPTTSDWNICPTGTDHNVQVNTIAFGEDWSVDTALLTNIKNRFAGEAFPGTYTITTDAEDLIQYFIQTVASLYQANLVSANPSGTEFDVNAGERRLIVILSWTSSGGATTFNLQQKPNAADPWPAWPTGQVSCTQSDSDTTVGYGICTVDNPASGRWRVVDGTGNPFTAADSQFVLVDLNLRARFAFDQKVHGTGLDIILTADLKEGAVPVTHGPANHPVKVTVSIKRPGEGFGTYVSTRTLESCEPSEPNLPPIDKDIDFVKGRISMSSTVTSGSQPAGGDTKPARFEKIDSLFRLCEKDSLIFIEDPGIELHDDGTHSDTTPNDGIYTLHFTNTQYEGSYVFHFKASGTSPSGNTFSRVKTIAEYLRVEVDPSETDFSWREYQRSGSIVVGQIYVVPRDRFKGYLGPGYPDRVQFKTSAGSFIGPVIDHNNSIYSQLLRYDESKERPKVTAVIQDKQLSPIKAFKAFEIVPFAGYTFFDNSLKLDDGVVVGAKLGYRFTYRLTLELEGGVTFTDSSAGDSGHVIQALLNARYDIYSVNTRLGQLTPYVTAGAGGVLFRGFGNDDEAFAVQGGVGATLNLSNDFGIRVDSRVFQFTDALNAGSTTNFQVTGGIVFRF